MASDSGKIKWRQTVLEFFNADELLILRKFVPLYLKFAGRYIVHDWAKRDCGAFVVLAGKLGQKKGAEIWSKMPPESIARFFHWVMFRFVADDEAQCALRAESHLSVLKECLPVIEKLSALEARLAHIQRQCLVPSRIVTNEAVGDVIVTEHARLRFCQRAKGMARAVEPGGPSALFQRSFAEAVRRQPPSYFFLSRQGKINSKEIFLENSEQGIWFVIGQTLSYDHQKNRFMRVLVTVIPVGEEANP